MNTEFRVIWPDMGDVDGPFPSLRDAREARKQKKNVAGPGIVQRRVDSRWVRA